MGRRTRITPEQLAIYAGAMCPQAEVARIIGVSESAISQMLKKPEYRAAWDHARENTKFQIRKAQLENAIVERKTVDLIWAGKQYLDQRDSPQTVDQNVNVKVEYIATWGGGELPPPEDDGNLIEGEVEDE